MGETVLVKLSDDGGRGPFFYDLPRRLWSTCKLTFRRLWLELFLGDELSTKSGIGGVIPLLGGDELRERVD